ncbi:hypothetical protein Mpe_A0539 [Methylibium petroleiphilum PM1]|uniref:Uncharacterized protein n=2 Tax=Methylibium TaxID=316612 RepID=A2SD62_METPP|nr:hypothetical protein Mpe_A0539 [Methylibium petroleiphilum PM1]
MKDMYNNVDVRRAISPVSVSDNTQIVSQVIDMLGYRSLTFCIAIGSVADADAVFTVLLENSATSDMSTAYDVYDKDMIGTEFLASFRYDSDNQVRKLGYTGGERYVRMTIIPSGNASAALISAVAVLGHPVQCPVP